MAVEKYLNPNYTEGGSEPKYISLPNLTVEGGESGITEDELYDKLFVFIYLNELTSDKIEEIGRKLVSYDAFKNKKHIIPIIIKYADNGGTASYEVADYSFFIDPSGFTVKSINLYSTIGTLTLKGEFNHSSSSEYTYEYKSIEKISQKILTETEYSALGTTPETDNVLYFVTPD